MVDVLKMSLTQRGRTEPIDRVECWFAVDGLGLTHDINEAVRSGRLFSAVGVAVTTSMTEVLPNVLNAKE